MDDYIQQTELTASGVFNPSEVGVGEFCAVLAAVVDAARTMDLYKKLMFRKRTRAEVQGLTIYNPLWTPLDDASNGFAKDLDKFADLFHGIVGLITETGELAEVLLNFVDHEAQPDIHNVREEIGDNLWYLARLVKWADTTFPDEMARNIAKLRARHGAAGFNKEADIHRNLSNERAVIEGEAPGGKSV